MVNDGRNPTKADTEENGADDRPAVEAAVRLRIERDIGRQLLRSTLVGSLIDNVCALLTRGGLCASAAILLWDGDGTIIDSAQAGPSGVLADLIATTSTDMLPTDARPALDASSGDACGWRKTLNGDIHLFPLRQTERAIGLLAVAPASARAGVPGDLQWISVLADDIAVGILRLQQGTIPHKRFRMESLLPDDQSELIKGMVYRCRNDPRWTMTALSGSVVGLTGYRVEQLIDNREAAYGDLIDPAYRDWVWTKVQEGVEQNQPFKITYPICKSSGERRWVWERGRGV